MTLELLPPASSDPSTSTVPDYHISMYALPRRSDFLESVATSINTGEVGG
jgi:hypothetical protein